MRDVAQAANISKEAAKQIGVNALLDMIQNETGSVRIAALRLWAAVFELIAPHSLRVGDPTGKPLAPTVARPIVQFVIPDNGRGPSIARPAQIEEHIQETGG
jgi:hypothetical protein